MIDHLIIGVRDLAASRAFYERALAPLGIHILFEHPTSGTGFGSNGKPEFFLASRAPSSPLHVAFAGPDRATVDAFHEAALAGGATDNGAPGLRPHYHASYYGAFVLDPDGNNIEAVCHGAA